MLDWFLQNYDKRNIVLLEGNHERWLMDYANGEYDDDIRNGISIKCKSPEFFNSTIPQIEGLPKKELRQFCRRFRAMAFIEYDGRRYLISHAGLGFMPDSLIKIKAQAFIRSNGKYEDPIDQWFEEHELERNPDLVQIHAHRNTLSVPIKASKNSYNLCDEVEFGGNLRIIEISHD